MLSCQGECENGYGYVCYVTVTTQDLITPQLINFNWCIRFSKLLKHLERNQEPLKAVSNRAWLHKWCIVADEWSENCESKKNEKVERVLRTAVNSSAVIRTAMMGPISSSLLVKCVPKRPNSVTVVMTTFWFHPLLFISYFSIHSHLNKQGSESNWSVLINWRVKWRCPKNRRKKLRHCRYENLSCPVHKQTHTQFMYTTNKHIHLHVLIQLYTLCTHTHKNTDRYTRDVPVYQCMLTYRTITLFLSQYDFIISLCIIGDICRRIRVHGRVRWGHPTLLLQDKAGA